jgi:hypothetical protein
MFLNWNDYPNPTLVMRRGKWVVCVSIPTSIRHCFGNCSCSGTTTKREKSTGTNDHSLAKRKEQDIAHKIYKDFDEAQLEYANLLFNV